MLYLDIAMKEKTILVVDDQPEIIQYVATELYKEGGYAVLNASNGEVALNIARDTGPDVILMDWDMPVLNGIEATKKLKKLPETFKIPVLIMTGQMTSSKDLEVALEAGAEDFIRKPIDIVEMLARLHTVLRIKDQHFAINELLKKEIELKDRRLSSTSMLMVEKNHLLNDILTRIEELERAIHDPSKVGRRLDELKKLVIHAIDMDNSWETFKMHFDEVHPNFFTRVKDISSDLSHKDLKLCAYLKLGIENKQIANLLNISPASASTSLFRLKKKLNLEEEANLRDVIIAL